MHFARIKDIVRRIFYSSYLYLSILVFIIYISVCVLYEESINDEHIKLNTTNNKKNNKSIYNLDDVKQVLLSRHSKHSKWDHIVIKAVVSTFMVIFVVTFLILCRYFIKKYTPTIVNLFTRRNRNEPGRDNEPVTLYQDIYQNADSLEYSSEDDV